MKSPEHQQAIQKDKQDIEIIVGTLYDSKALRPDIDKAVFARLGLEGCEREYNVGFEVANAIWKAAISNGRVRTIEVDRVAFNHQANHPGLAMGVSDTERIKEIQDTVARVADDPHLDHTKASQMLEEVYQMIEPTTEADRVFAAYAFGLELGMEAGREVSPDRTERPAPHFPTGAMSRTE